MNAPRHRTLIGFPVILALLLAGPGAFVGPAPAEAQSTVQLDPEIRDMLGEISADRVETVVRSLADFETRHSLSSTDDPDRGIGAAREWMMDELRSYSDRLDVGLDCYRIPAQGRITREAEICNVLAILPGRSDRRIYIGGHYDSVARVLEEFADEYDDYENPAPGANDDASGTALGMEVMRVLAQSGKEFDATLVFIGFAGEEQGLVGARLHAQRADEEGLTIDALFSNDIVGNAVGGTGIQDGASVRVYSPGPLDSPARQLARYIARHSGAYVPSHRIKPVAREDRFGRGGDHTPFNWYDFAAVRFTEPRENYARQHTVDDVPDAMDFDYLARNARVNLASMAALALAPAAPETGRLSRGSSGYDARLTWEPSEGAASYRVFVRDAWSMDWETVVEVGDVTEYVFEDLSIDSHVFGVAAVGPDGHESLVSPYVRSPRSPSRVETLDDDGGG